MSREWFCSAEQKFVTVTLHWWRFVIKHKNYYSDLCTDELNQTVEGAPTFLISWIQTILLACILSDWSSSNWTRLIHRKKNDAIVVKKKKKKVETWGFSVCFEHGVLTLFVANCQCWKKNSLLKKSQSFSIRGIVSYNNNRNPQIEWY